MSDLDKDNYSEEPLATSSENLWITFKIPWNKMTNFILDNCKKATRNPRTVNSVIHVVADATQNIRFIISNKAIRIITHKIESKYPNMFQDIDDDGTVPGDDGAISVFNKLRERLL